MAFLSTIRLTCNLTLRAILLYVQSGFTCNLALLAIWVRYTKELHDIGNAKIVEYNSAAIR